MFLYRLALRLGIWDVETLADEMDVDQLYGWMGYYQLEPWGDEWLRDAMHMAQFAGAHRSKNGPRRKPEDFMPVPKRAQTPEQILAAFQSISPR